MRIIDKRDFSDEIWIKHVVEDLKGPIGDAVQELLQFMPDHLQDISLAEAAIEIVKIRRGRDDARWQNALRLNFVPCFFHANPEYMDWRTAWEKRYSARLYLRRDNTIAEPWFWLEIYDPNKVENR